MRIVEETEIKYFVVLFPRLCPLIVLIKEYGENKDMIMVKVLA